MVLPRADAFGAYKTLQEELLKIREGGGWTPKARIRFSDYVVSLCERKIRKRKIRSAKSKEVWFNVLRVHLLPPFGDFFVDAIRRQDIDQWLDGAAKRVEDGDYSPVTVNNWLRMLKVIMSAAASEFEWERSGGYRTSTGLTKPFDDVCRVMGLNKKISARAMRRTFQDLAREANIDSIVQRSICDTPRRRCLSSTAPSDRRRSTGRGQGHLDQPGTVS
jgi:hypothetical protein